jgi:hypothetical protein
MRKLWIRETHEKDDLESGIFCEYFAKHGFSKSISE